MPRDDLDPWALDRAHTLHPYTQFGPFEREGSLVIARGEGVWLWDRDGRRYLDAVGGMWCTNVGLGRAEIAEAMADQARRLAYCSTFVDMTNEPAARLAATLAELAPPGLGRVHFTTCGSTAVDTALRMVAYVQTCRGLPEKTQIVARDGSYHGSTLLTMSAGKRKGDRIPEFRYLTEGIHHLSCPDSYHRPPGMEEGDLTAHLVAEFEALIARVGPERIGGFIAEPIQASGGVILPPPGYLRAMREICDRHGILFIADEVVTAFGRLGHWFASEAVFGVVPDMICVAKGLTSAYAPMGAVIFSDRLWADMAADPSRWFTSGLTYAGHPVCAAAALASIEILRREELLANAARVGAYLLARIEALRDLPLVGDVRGLGLMACVETVADKATRRPLPDGIGESKRISNAAEAMGLLVRPLAHLNVMSPPLILTEAQADEIAETLGRAIRQVADELVREGVRLG
jgi:adenosylmethionine-8-amino-7-oxononanoate aminotransferase